MDERMSYLRAHHGVKRDRQSAEELMALDREAILAQQRRSAEERRKVLRLNPNDEGRASREYLGLIYYKAMQNLSRP